VAEQKSQPARGNKGARLLGWWIGIMTILGTAALIAAALMGPARQQVAAPEKPPRVCPPQVSVPTRPIGFPVDDVLGVRPGMSARDVEEIVKCMSEDYEIGTEGVPVPSAGKKRTRPVLRVNRGEDTVSFALFGAEGQEQVAAMWREAVFDVGAGPPGAEVEAMLSRLYGAPHEARDSPDGARILMWTYAPDGRPIRVRAKDGDIAGAVAYMTAGFTAAGCIKNVKIDPAAPPAWDGRCGLTIRAEIDPSLSDRSRTARWRLAVLDQATLQRQAQSLRALGAATPP
jgi:hypothetical protein